MILSVKNIQKSYISDDNKTEDIVINDLTLEIEQGSHILIHGPSGAGKSTLLHILGGLDVPTNGEVLFKGIPLPKNKNQMSDIRNKEFGFIFQFHYLLPEFTILENLLLAGVYHYDNEDQLKERANNLIDQVGLTKRKHGLPTELSGGERQRVAVIRALINDPQIVFADEPTGNLDNKNREKVYNLLADYLTKTNKTLILVSHDTNIPIPTLKKIKMQDGRLL